MARFRVDPNRLLDRITRFGSLGATSSGGCTRLAATALNAEADNLLLELARPLVDRVERDRIGNLFLRREGRDPGRGAIAFGSHLDTVPEGGRYDGVFGVLAGLAVLEAIHEADLHLPAPLELVVFQNEEGSRFSPPMLGSRVMAGALGLEQALDTQDEAGVTLRQALAETGQAGPVAPGDRGWACFLEAHIEQGPELERAAHAAGGDPDRFLGIVTHAFHVRYFAITLTGASSHVGPTAMPDRRDSLAAAAELILAIEAIGRDSEPLARASCPWIQNEPNVRGANPGLTRLACDLRAADPGRLPAMEQALRERIATVAQRRGIAIELTQTGVMDPARFDPGLRSTLQRNAESLGLLTLDLAAAAGHDAVLITRLCPTAMLFVTSVNGITHHPDEFSTPGALANGAQVLLDTVLELAR